MMDSCRSYTECRNSSLEDFSNIQWKDFFDDIRKPKADPTIAVSHSNASHKPTALTRTRTSCSSDQNTNDAVFKSKSKVATSFKPESTSKKQPLQEEDLHLKARAKFDFVAQTTKECNLIKGQTVTITKQVDNNWYMVQSSNGGKSGIVPVTYLEILPKVSPENHCENGYGRAKFDLTAIGKHELSLKKDDEIVLLKKVDDNWYQGKLRGKIGIVPVVYLDITSEPKNNDEKGASVTSYAHKQRCLETTTPLPHSRQVSTTTTSQPRSNELEDKHKIQKANESFPVFPTAKSRFSLSSNESTKYLGRKTSEDDISSCDIEKIAIEDKSSEESDVNDLTNTLKQNEFKGPKDKNTSQPFLKKKSYPIYSASVTAPVAPDTFNLSSSSSSTSVPSPQPSNQPSPDYGQVIGRYVALYTYTACNDDELDLLPGDMVMVVEVCDDGWYVGTSQRTEAFGTFPGNYVSLANTT